MKGCGRKIGPYDCCTIVTGDARELAKAIPDESVDLIFTDPPYSKEYLYLYAALFEIGARVLTPDGFLLTYAGGYWKDEVMAMARTHLDYFWDHFIVDGADSVIIWPRKIITRGKSILAYRRRGSNGLPVCNTLGLWQGGGKDKRYHHWGQDENTARYYIGCFSSKGQAVLDPFCGGGTTLYACKKMGVHYLGFEIDPKVARQAGERVMNTQASLAQPEQAAMDL